MDDKTDIKNMIETMKTLLNKDIINLSNFDFEINNFSRVNIQSSIFERKSQFVDQLYSQVSFTPHSITHIDLPLCIGLEERQAALEYDDSLVTISEEPHDILNSLTYYSEVNIFDDALFLDFSWKANNIKEKYVNPKDGFFYSDLNNDVFEDLIKDLEITKFDFLKIQNIDELKKKFLIIKTNWDDFALVSESYSNPYFYFRHPLVTHPFISLETMKWLVKECNITGIGCDISGLDNPMYYTRSNFLPEYSERYYFETFLKQFPRFRPVSLLTLFNNLYYINHLTNLTLINAEMCSGILILIPISLNLRDANLVQVYFWRTN